jgi:hypothetical protein
LQPGGPVVAAAGEGCFTPVRSRAVADRWVWFVRTQGPNQSGNGNLCCSGGCKCSCPIVLPGFGTVSSKQEGDQYGIGGLIVLVVRHEPGALGGSHWAGGRCGPGVHAWGGPRVKCQWGVCGQTCIYQLVFDCCTITSECTKIAQHVVLCSTHVNLFKLCR